MLIAMPACKPHSCLPWLRSPNDSPIWHSRRRRRDRIFFLFHHLRFVLELFVFMGIYWLLEVSPSSPPNNVSLLHLQSVGFFIHWFDSKNWDHPAVTFFQHLNQVPPNHSPLRRHISTYRCSADWSDDPGRICLKEEEQGTGRWRRKRK